MQVSVVSDISKNGNKMEKWALSADVNPQSQWTWPPRRTPTRQNMKVWRDCLRGTFMKGLDDLMQPVIETNQNCYRQVAFPAFNYKGMRKKYSLMATIRQYPTELLSLFGGYKYMIGRVKGS